MNLSFASGLDSVSVFKKVGAHERGSNTYPYLDVVEGDMENRIPIPREAEESNGTIDVLSCLPSPLAMLLSPNIPRTETPMNSIGVEREGMCGTLVFPDQKKGGLPEYSFPADFLKGRSSLPSHYTDKYPVVLYTHKEAAVPKLQISMSMDDASSMISSEQQVARSFSLQCQRIVQHSLSPRMSPSFGDYTTPCRSLTSSWSSIHRVNSFCRPVRGTSASLCLCLYIWWWCRGFAMLAYLYLFLLCFDLILTDVDNSTGLPQQPSVPNVDDSTSSVVTVDSLPLGTCDTQTISSSKRTSQFAGHDVSVFIRYVLAIIHLLSCCLVLSSICFSFIINTD